MHIAVILRRIPDLSEDLEISDDKTNIDREWIGYKLNEFDDHALEEAIALKEQYGARVTALALAGDGADRILQTAFARGADAMFRLEHQLDLNKMSDYRSQAAIFQRAVSSLEADLVLTGVQTPEDLFGPLAPLLAGLGGWLTLNAITGITFNGKEFVVRQEHAGGRTTNVALTALAVLGVQTASRPPRYVSGTKLREAMSAEIGAVNSGSSLVPSRQAVQQLDAPKAGKGATMLPNEAALAAKQLVTLLAERGLIGG